MGDDEKLKKYIDALSPFLPEGSYELACRWLIDFRFDLKLTQSRKTKLGDYRVPYGNKRHQITVNHNLNPYAFLITFGHEVAHMAAHIKFGVNIKPHGAEWKNEFRLLMQPFFDVHVFPDEIKRAFAAYLENPAASSCSDDELSRALKRYDKNRQHLFHLEDLPYKSMFRYSGRYFEKGERLRKRFRCRELSSGHLYLFNPITEVLPVQEGVF
jgi:SprT protein